MGLMIHSLEMLSSEAQREYYIYLLDYGWSEPLSDIIKKNFQKFASWASKNDSAIITGVGEIGHFDNEVLSWHQINGHDAVDILPAILITRTNPHIFRVNSLLHGKGKNDIFSFVLIPLKKICKDENDVLRIISRIMKDVEDKKDLTGFAVQKELKPSIGKAIAKSVILEPNISGVGFSFNKLKEFLK